jgi:hypothetical protein
VIIEVLRGCPNKIYAKFAKFSEIGFRRNATDGNVRAWFSHAP